MPYISVSSPDSANPTNLYVRDWGSGRPVVLIHGWPLSGASWEYQALPLVDAGFRVIAYDRRGFGQSSKPFEGYDYDTMSDDLRAIIDTLELRDAALVGFSMAGGEIARYMSRHEGHQVRQTALVSSIAPFMLKTDSNPDGVPNDTFEEIKAGLRKDRAAFLADFFKDFYGQGTEAGGVSDQILHWSWSLAMDASPKATLDCVDAFGKTDLRPDMDAFDVPTLVIHGTEDQTVPIDPTGRAAADSIRGAELKEYDGAPHGVTATHPEQLTQDLLEFLKG